MSAWEEAVLWLRGQVAMRTLVRSGYYDDPLQNAAKRFRQSDEWMATQRLLPCQRGRALDLGAGRGIASAALARMGWQVTALEPDPGDVVGRGAILALAAQEGVQIDVVEDKAEKLPFKKDSFDLVYSREVLHHCSDLHAVCAQVARVLRPRGRWLAVREHVISHEDDLNTFLEAHPVHRLYGGENALLPGAYLSAMRKSGLRPARVLRSFDSVINYYPMTEAQLRTECGRLLMPFVGYRMSKWAGRSRLLLNKCVLRLLARQLSSRDQTPGRLFSFVLLADRRTSVGGDGGVDA